jgi:hypothetical protein
VKDIECTPVKRLAIAREEGSKQKKQPQLVKVEEKVTKAPLVCRVDFMVTPNQYTLCFTCWAFTILLGQGTTTAKES